MAKIIITQSILWAAAIISTALVAPSDSGWLLLTVLATISIGTLKNGINSSQKWARGVMYCSKSNQSLSSKIGCTAFED